MRVGIFDYGAGNLFNISLALEREGLDTTIVQDIPQNSQLDGLVLPGVGNFKPAISRLNRCRERVLDFLTKGRPVLGICLGMQLLFESSQEGPADGLGLFKGKILQFPHSVKVPHMGWNQLRIKKTNGLLEGISEGSWCYFVHSYYPSTQDPIVSAETEYGVVFPCVIESGQLTGTQFHPEKSGETGRRLLHNFADVLKR